MNCELQVRLAALQAIILILRQGLVHPAQVRVIQLYNCTMLIIASLIPRLLDLFSVAVII